jgi:hypothetical protein
VKAAVFRDLVTTTDDLRKQIKALTVELGATRQALTNARDDVEFHEGAAGELLDCMNALPDAIAGEWQLLSTLDGETVAFLLAVWRDVVGRNGLPSAPSFAGLLAAMDESP